MQFILYVLYLILFLIITYFIDKYLGIKHRLINKIQSNNVYYVLLFSLFAIVALTLNYFDISVFYPSMSSALIYAILIYFYFR